jgi:hypothetical protein
MRLHVTASTLLSGTCDPKKVGRLGRLVSKLHSHAFVFIRSMVRLRSKKLLLMSLRWIGL